MPRRPRRGIEEKESSMHGSELICQKARKSNGKKPRKPRDTPHDWLKRLICSFDFGLKVTIIDPETAKSSSKPIHCNKNRDILAAFRDNRRWMFLDRMSNSMLDGHWSGDETFYFTGPGSPRCRFALFNFDIDCHDSGSPEGAFEAAEYLKATFFPGLYHEPSTNGRGRHGYFILDKEGLGAEDVKRLLKALERHLNLHLLSQGFDIELFEVKGLPPVITWNDGEVTNYTAGVLAKIPRQVHRFEEWKRTTVMSHVEIRRVVNELRPSTSSQVPVTPKRPPSMAMVVEDRAKGSVTGKVIGEGELAQLAEGGHYRKVAATLLGTHTLQTTGRTVVTAEDVTIFLACLKFFTGRMNADGTLPVRRFEGLWSALHEAGDVGRAFDCHRFKAIRDYLSDLGLLYWEDRTFVAPTKDHHGNKSSGRACKWKANETLVAMLGWQKSAVGVETTQVMDIHEEKEGVVEASLVGTKPSPSASPVSVKLVEAVRSLIRVPEGQEIRPAEVVSTGRRLRLFTPEDVTRLVMDYEESMTRLAA